MIVVKGVVLEGGLHVMLGANPMAGQHFIERLVKRAAVPLACGWRTGAAMLDSWLGAESVEDMLGNEEALVALQPIGERLVIIDE